jgi:hypothetical protein
MSLSDSDRREFSRYRWVFNDLFDKKKKYAKVSKGINLGLYLPLVRYKNVDLPESY